METAPDSHGHNSDLTSRARIRNAGLHQFATSGFAGTPMRAIAAEAGVIIHGTRVRHSYASKETWAQTCHVIGSVGSAFHSPELVLPICEMGGADAFHKCAFFLTGVCLTGEDLRLLVILQHLGHGGDGQGPRINGDGSLGAILAPPCPDWGGKQIPSPPHCPRVWPAGSG